jgi:transposase
MSMHPQSVGAIPEETKRVAQAAFPKGCLCLRVRDILGPIFTDEQFADLFASRGRPAEAPWRLAIVSVLQYVEGLSDRQAAEAVRGRIEWKYLLGLDLTDAGFDHTVLCEFRERLLAGGAETRLLQAILAVCRQQGWIHARGTQRADSTHVLMAARVLNRLEEVGETLRAVLNALAASAPDWLQERVPIDWFDRYSRRIEEYRLPKGEDARRAYAEQIGTDGQLILLWMSMATTPETVKSLPALQVLREVWEQQYVVDAGRLRWRTPAELLSAGARIDSPYDPDAHYGTKRSTSWVGYKVHLTPDLR